MLLTACYFFDSMIEKRRKIIPALMHHKPAQMSLKCKTLTDKSFKFKTEQRVWYGTATYALDIHGVQRLHSKENSKHIFPKSQ
jgi:hypothetical protein